MDLASATAAPRVLTLGDKQYTFGRLTLRDWGELEQAALEAYRREYLQTRLTNADLLADGDVAQYRQRVLNDALRLRLDDLPKQRCRVMKVDARGRIEFDAYHNPLWQEKEVEYQVWWLHETMAGRLHAIWLSLRKHHPEMTLADLDGAIIDEFVREGINTEQLANMVGDMSSASVGNSSAPPMEAAPSVTMEQLGARSSERSARRMRRRQRRSQS